MRWSMFSVTVLGFALTVASLNAQENLRFRFEVLKNGSQIAAPMVTVQEKQTGSVAVEEVATISFTPSRVDGDRISLTLEVISADKTLKPRLVLFQQQSGSVAWKSTSGSDSFEIRVVALP